MSKQATVLCQQETAPWVQEQWAGCSGAADVVCEDLWGTWEILAKLPPGSVKPDP